MHKSLIFFPYLVSQSECLFNALPSLHKELCPGLDVLFSPLSPASIKTAASSPENKVRESSCLIVSLCKINRSFIFQSVRFWGVSWVKGVVSLHIKPYKKDIYDHIRCSTALLWQLVQFWEQKLVADITASWKQQRSMTSTQTIHQTINIYI